MRNSNPINFRRWTCDTCSLEIDTPGEQPPGWIGVLIAVPPLRSQGDVDRTLHCPECAAAIQTAMEVGPK